MEYLPTGGHREILASIAKLVAAIANLDLALDARP